MNRTTSWQKVAPWYNKITRGGEGHYYHEHVIIPNVLRLLELNIKSQNSNIKLLDLACGNGVLAKSLPKDIKYTGIDLAESLIKYAKIEDKNYNHKYIVGDITQPLIFHESFTHATIILALQNISDPFSVFQNASKFLIPDSRFIIVLNHPAFRIPRQSAWGIDEERKIQYRRIDKYMSPMEIPINPHTYKTNARFSADHRNIGVGVNEPLTISYHYPLSDYSKMLKDAGFVIELIEEWTSDKESVGRAGRMENRSRAEIPLFMAIAAIKK